MSFCIRGIASNGSRYVVQGCAAAGRSYSSRQLPARARSAAASNTTSSSAFLNEFLGSNAQLSSSLRIKDECKLSNEPLQVEELLQSSSNEVVEHDTHPMSRLRESRHLLTNQEENWLHLKHRTNFTSLGALPTKDETKVQFSAVPGTATAVLNKESTAEDNSDKASPNKKANGDLVHVYETLKVDFPAFFVKSIDYRLYHPEIEFINNIRGKNTKGIYEYVKQMAFLRTVGHLKFAYVKMDVLKITMHTQDNTVRVRWRINGITGMKVLLMFWKFKFWKIRESLKESEVWHDGFSTFYVGDDGLVFKHVAEKMMPDQEINETKPKTGIQSKLASQLTFSSVK